MSNSPLGYYFFGRGICKQAVIWKECSMNRKPSFPFLWCLIFKKIRIPVVLVFYLRGWLQIGIKHCCSSSDILWNHWCLPAKLSERAGAEGWGKCLTSPVSVQSFPLITDSAHEKFLDEKALRELAVTEWAAKGKLFIPVFFP